jgi:hypothetical protein
LDLEGINSTEMEQLHHELIAREDIQNAPPVGQRNILMFNNR